MTAVQCPDDTQADLMPAEGNDEVEQTRPQRPVVSKDDLAAMAKRDKDVSLSALVRQWMKTADALERQARPAGDDSPLVPKWTPPKEDPLVSAGNLTTVATPALPRRRRQSVSQPTRRLAVLIDAEATNPVAAEALFAALADEGSVCVSRAYGDWTSPKTRAWWPGPLRQHAIQPHHHFSQLNDQRALVALTIDAVDLAREAAVDVVVIVGDLASLHPLIVRLNGCGIQVIAFGTTPTPADVRALCHEFVDLTDEPGGGSSGKHSA